MQCNLFPELSQALIDGEYHGIETLAQLSLCPKLSSTKQVLDSNHLRMLCLLQKCIAYEF